MASAPVSINELKEKYAILSDSLWGDCIVIPRADFTSDLDTSLGNQGYRRHFTNLDRHAVVMVQLKKASAAGNVQASKEVKKTQKVEEQTSLKDPSWDYIDDLRLIKRMEEETGTLLERAKKLMPAFNDRTAKELVAKFRCLKNAQQRYATNGF